MRFSKVVSALLIGIVLSGGRCASGDVIPAQGVAMSTIAPSHNIPKAPMVEKYLMEANLEQGELVLSAHLLRHQDDDQTRFGLGVLQFLHGIEELAQDFYHYGLRSVTGLSLPFLRLPVPETAHPAALDYLHARGIAEKLVRNFAKAEATLAQITDPNVKLPLHFGMIRLDLSGSGRPSQQMNFWKLYSRISGNQDITEEKARNFLITFDRGDVHWLRGYCHLLSSICEIYLAYDSKETFDCTAHLFFANVDTPYKFLNNGKKVHAIKNDIDVVDLIALIHTIHWPLAEPPRMQSALHHWEAVTAQSRESWRFIMAETDDDHEWIPNPKQTGVLPNAHVTAEMVTAWLTMMSEIDKLLAGQVLVLFWRGDGTQGINVRKVFTDPPRHLDIVLWVQGTEAAPYLQRGKITDAAKWRQVRDTFGGNFPGFAVWFN
jgi:hypothetical protein